MTITCETSELHDTESGRIAEVAFKGNMGIGSDGNDQADEMAEYVCGVLATDAPEAVLFDMSRLEYSWGDGLFTVFVALGSQRPIGVFAAPKTRVAIESLIESTGGLGRLLSIRVFDNRSEARRFIEERLNADDSEEQPGTDFLEGLANAQRARRRGD